MNKVDIKDIDAEPEGSRDLDRRPLSDHLGTTNVALNYYVLEPGEAFAGGMHAHLDQEEVFFVVKGVATFETKSDAAAESHLINVQAGQAIRFGPGEFQQGRNETDKQVVALAIGAPKESTTGRVPHQCPECGDSNYMDTVMIEEKLMVECPECGVVKSSGLH